MSRANTRDSECASEPLSLVQEHARERVDGSPATWAESDNGVRTLNRDYAAPRAQLHSPSRFD